MYRNYFKQNYIIPVLVSYPDRKNSYVIHHEVRKLNTVTMMDTRMSDFKLDDATYPNTDLDFISYVPMFEIERARKGSGWVCLDRNSRRVLGRFSSFDDALAFGKMKEAKQKEKESHFKNHLTF